MMETWLFNRVKPGLNLIRILSLLIGLVCLSSCSNIEVHETNSWSRESFSNVLDVEGTPEERGDFSTFFFSDQGAWFGFALPDSGDFKEVSAIVGPFLMSHGEWIGKSFAQLEIIDLQSESKKNLLQSATRVNEYFPGLLSCSMTADRVTVNQQLWFDNQSMAIVQAKVKNISSEPLSIKPVLRGSSWIENISMNATPDGISARLQDTGDELGVHLLKDEIEEIRLSSDYNGYEIVLSSLEAIAPGNTMSIRYAISFNENPSHENAQQQDQEIQQVLKKIDNSFDNNTHRWNGYISKILSARTQFLSDVSYQRLAVKSLQTLILNWRAGRGSLEHGGLFPSASVWYFNGFWGWDSWKHAVALARFEPQLAEEQILTMFDHQDEYGMIADCVYADSSEDNWRNTKPPLAAWSVKKLYDLTKNHDFVEIVYPKMVKYHEWWYQNRDHDKNGLCEYGSTDGTIIAARWESGVDDGVHYDSTNIVQNNPSAWSMDQESVDLNAYLWFEKRCLAELADVLQRKVEAQYFRAEAADLQTQIQDLMFDEAVGYFFDIRLDDKSKIEVYGSQGWIPLWVGLASKDQATAVRNHMVNPEKFATYLPLPTVAKDNPEFMTGYWRGPVWLDQAFFGISGLRRYGFEEDANNFSKQIFQRAEGLLNDKRPIRENYNPLTGEGMKVNHFSWSAAHLLMMQWQM